MQSGILCPICRLNRDHYDQIDSHDTFDSYTFEILASCHVTEFKDFILSIIAFYKEMLFRPFHRSQEIVTTEYQDSG